MYHSTVHMYSHLFEITYVLYPSLCIYSIYVFHLIRDSVLVLVAANKSDIKHIFECVHPVCLYIFQHILLYNLTAVRYSVLEEYKHTHTHVPTYAHTKADKRKIILQ